jgi:hypothetical protein
LWSILGLTVLLSGSSGDGKPLSKEEWTQMQEEIGKLKTDLDLVDVSQSSVERPQSNSTLVNLVDVSQSECAKEDSSGGDLPSKNQAPKECAEDEAETLMKGGIADDGSSDVDLLTRKSKKRQECERKEEMVVPVSYELVDEENGNMPCVEKPQNNTLVNI